MSYTPKIVAFAGSLRKDSCNKKLAKIAARAAEKAGAQVTFLDLNDFALPLYNGDLEESEGVPEAALKLKKIFNESDGFIIASPEYNSSLAPALKNTLDWISRPIPNEKPLAPFTDKVALLISASPGALGGLRGLVHLRSMLQNINTYVIPGQKCLSNAYEAFDAEGELKNPSDHQAIEKLSAKLVEATRKLKG